LNWINSN